MGANTMIGRALVQVYQNEFELGDTSLESEVNDLVEKLKEYVSQNGFEEISEALLNLVYLVKSELVIRLANGTISQKNFLQAAEKGIENHLGSSGWSSLRKAMVLSLDLVSDINKSFLHNLFPDSNRPAQPIEKAGSLAELTEKITQQGNGNEVLISRNIHFIHASLIMEIHFMLAQFCLEGDNIIPREQHRDLALEMIANVEMYVAYAIYLGLWNPGEEDERALVRNSQIIAASLQFSPAKITV